MEEKNSQKSIEPSFPRQARVVIIGGGVIGCSSAYHLTKLECMTQRVNRLGIRQLF